MITYNFGYSRHHGEIWARMKWCYGQDTRHEYWWFGIATIGLDGIDG
jgi:hypothetical protein